MNEIGKFYKPWFFKHVESFVRSWKTGEEYIPLKDYYFRHNGSLFWEIQVIRPSTGRVEKPKFDISCYVCFKDIIPFGNHPFFRYSLGWLMPAKVALLKLTQTETIKQLYNKHHFIDDFIVPINSLEKCVRRFHDSLNVTNAIWRHNINHSQ